MKRFKIVIITLLSFACIIEGYFMVDVLAQGNEHVVTTFDDLKRSIDEAPIDGTEVTITIDGVIDVTSTLTIHSDKNIVLKALNEGSALKTSQQMSITDSLILIHPNAKLVIGERVGDVDLVIDANKITSGGMIRNINGYLTLNSGLITGTTGVDPSPAGGAIDNDGVFVMNGGSISGNKAYGASGGNGGGAVLTTNSFIMNGGVMENNEALAVINNNVLGSNGGAIFVKSGSATLNGGILRNNKAASGGAVYVYGVSSTPGEFASLFINNALITSNFAEESGGGVWLCQSGVTNSSTSMGTTIVGNSVPSSTGLKEGGDDFYSEIKINESYFVNLPQRTINGKPMTWYRDTPNNRYIDGNRDIVESGDYVLSEEIYLHTEVNKEDIDSVRDMASMIIENNSAIVGGGIASNGIITFGVENEDVSYHVMKQWEDQSTVHPDVEVQLYQYIDANADGHIDEIERASGTPIDDPVVLNNDNSWNYKWNNLPKYYTDGINWIFYEYDVIEITEFENYMPKVSDVVFDTVSRTYSTVITNIETVNIEGKKVWLDDNNQLGLRPNEIVVKLYQSVSGQKEFVVEQIITNQNDNIWNYRFDNLPKYENGVEIEYSVEEEFVPNYKVDYQGYTIINSIVPSRPVDTISIEGVKLWLDDDNVEGLRPEFITLQLYKKVDGASSEYIKEVKVYPNNDGNWYYKFDALPKYKDGSLIQYHVVELEVPGYEASYNGYTITNKRVVTPPQPNPVIKIVKSKQAQTGSRLELGFYGVMVSVSLCAVLCTLKCWKNRESKRNKDFK